MAKKSNARRITRRDAITLIGAGAIAGSTRSATAQPPHPSCKQPGSVGTYKKGATNVIASLTCCDETKNAVLVGVEEPGKKATQQGKAHLQPLRNRLVSDNLLEYCYMIWGLNETDAKRLFEEVPKQVGLDITKSGK